MIKRILLSVLIITALTANTNAEDEVKGRIYTFDDFSGGLNTKTSEFSIPKKQGVVCENVRFDTELGSISKRDKVNLFGTVSAINPILGLHRLYLLDSTKVLICNVANSVKIYNNTTGTFDTILSVSVGSKRWQWVTWHDMAIGTDGYNQPVKYDGSSSSATYLGSCLATDAGSGAGPDGVYTYKITFYTATYEVLFDVASNTITVSDSDIDLTMIPIAPTTFLGETVVGRKIYRTLTSGSVYKLLSNGTIANNTAVTLTDSDADGALGAAMPTVDDSTYFQDKPPLAKFALIHDNRLFLANDPVNNASRVFYSEDGLHDYFASDEYLDIRKNDGDEVTFMKHVLGLLTIGKNNSIQKIYTNGTSDEWSISDPISNIGCQAPYSVANTPTGLYYLATDGLYNFSGQFSKMISEVITPEIKDIDSTDLENCWGIYHNSVYYLAYPSSRVGASYNNRVFVFDTLSNSYAIDILNINCFAAFNSGTDFGVLYSGASDTGKIYSFAEEINEMVHRRHSDFTGLWDDMRYIPESVGGDSTSPVLEISRTETIDELVGTIDEQVGVIDRTDTNGHYVSQPVTTLNAVYDKLYWNEVIPTSGGTVTFQLRTSPTGEKNLLLNDDYELWDNFGTEPNDWISVPSTTTTIMPCSSETTTVYRGDYAVKVNTSGTITQVLYNGSNYAGQTLVFDAWVNSTNSVADKVYIEIADGVSSSRAYYTNTSAWQNTKTTLAINSTATSISLKCATIGGADAFALFDQVMVKQGTSATNDWSEWSSEYTTSGSDISAFTADEYLQYMINMNTNDITVTPNIIKSSNFCVQLLYDKAGASQVENIPIEWQSGWLDFGASGYNKVLRKLYVLHEGESGTLSIKFDTLQGESDTFNIDLNTYPSYYTEYFTDGALTGEWIRMTITNDDDKPLKIKKIFVVYDINPLK